MTAIGSKLRRDNHEHVWTLINPVFKRFRCDCGVIAYQKNGKHIPYVCQEQLEQQRHCGQPAVYVTIERQQSRCHLHQVK